MLIAVNLDLFLKALARNDIRLVWLVLLEN